MDSGRSSRLLRSVNGGRRASGPKPTQPDFKSTRRFDWREGDVAFLHTWESFSSEDKEALIHSGYLARKATSHPVIILKRHSPDCTHVLITPISAYSSNKYNDWLPPWKQPYHAEKRPQDFRSFRGTERFSQKHKLLHVEGGRHMPKPKGSWVYIQSVFLVPVTVLGAFNKDEGERLRVTEDSRRDLLQHMTNENWTVPHLLNNPLLFQTATPPLPRQQVFRRNDWPSSRRWSNLSTGSCASTRSTSTCSQSSRVEGLSVDHTDVHSIADHRPEDLCTNQSACPATTWTSRGATGPLPFNSDAAICKNVWNKRDDISQSWRAPRTIGPHTIDNRPTIKCGEMAPRRSWALVAAGPKHSQQRLMEARRVLR